MILVGTSNKKPDDLKGYSLVKIILGISLTSQKLVLKLQCQKERQIKRKSYCLLFSSKVSLKTT